MVQRKVDIKSHLHKPTSSSLSQTPEKLIIKKMNKKTPPSTPLKQSPNYMKSTSSFEARKENSAKSNKPCSGSRTSSLNKVRTLTKTPSFKPTRSSKKVMLREDADSQRPTCSSTLKHSRFPNFKDGGGDELDGMMKVCPYSYCLLNGHHHAPRCFIKKPPAISAQDKDFFIDIYHKEPPINTLKSHVKKTQVMEVEIDEKEHHISAEKEHQIVPQELYDEKSVSSGAWSDEDADYASDSSCDPIKSGKHNMQSSTTPFDSDETNKTDDLQNLNHPNKDQNQQQSKTVPESAEKSNNETSNKHTTIVYNIINFNISVFINGEKTATVQVPAASVAADNMDTEEPMKEPSTSNEDCISSEINRSIVHEQPPIKVEEDIASAELLNETENHDNPEQGCNHSNSIDADTKMNEEPTIISDLDEIDVNLRDRKKPGQETEYEQPEFNPRGPNFLPETADPDAEKVDLKHQTVDERKNAEEWMVDFALQQAVTTLAPARKKKVALLVEAFEKVMPDPVPIPRHERHKPVSKAFTNLRTMQACS